MRIVRQFCVALLVTSGAEAQTAEPRLQDATVVAKGGTITISRLPIRTATGTIFRDVTIELHVTPDGRVTLATDGAGRALAAGRATARQTQIALSTGTPQADIIELSQRPSAPPVLQQFIPGTYSATDGSLMQLQDRGPDLMHDTPAWSIAAYNGPITSATFYTGPPQLNPHSKRLSRAGVTAAQYAYGTSDSGNGDLFGAGALIGVQQTGRTLRVVSFHHGCCRDGDAPTASITYTLVGR